MKIKQNVTVLYLLVVEGAGHGMSSTVNPDLYWNTIDNAFLNLNNGKEEKIDSWHWVTVVGVLYNDEKNILKATITDEGVLKNIDLGLWLETTTEEGGFVYYE